MNASIAMLAETQPAPPRLTLAEREAGRFFRRCYLCRSYSLDQATDLCDKCADGCEADGAEMLAGLAT